MNRYFKVSKCRGTFDIRCVHYLFPYSDVFGLEGSQKQLNSYQRISWNILSYGMRSVYPQGVDMRVILLMNHVEDARFRYFPHVI